MPTEDIAALSEDTYDEVLHTLHTRFQNKRIYTSIGENLLVVNPNERLPIYDGSVANQYVPGNDGSGRPSSKNIAHIFLICSKALEKLQNGSSSNEAIVFCGESGSGKTTNLFHAIRYFALQNASRIGIEQVNALQKICASFTGARTLKNDSSTRVGYSVELHLAGFTLNGLSITQTAPLELSRLVGQKKGDRNFGVFYELCAGLDANLKAKFGVKDANNYFYLNEAKCASSNGNSADSSKFAEMSASLTAIGFSANQKELIFRVLAAVLHVGNLFFITKKSATNEDFAEVGNENELHWIAYLLDVDYDSLKAIFTSPGLGAPKKLETFETEIAKSAGSNSKPQFISVDSALDLRDSLAKTIYNELFKWILSRISLFLQAPQPGSTKITLLDMFGFEKYNNTNGFEEFCVNTANERLENFFQQKSFKHLEDHLKTEQMAADDGGSVMGGGQTLPNNKRVLDLLTRRPIGLIPLLDDECKFPKGSDETFLQHCNINHLDKSIYAKARVKGRLELGVKHSAGLAFYSTEGWLFRNRWTQHASICAALSQSRDTSLAFIFTGLTGAAVQSQQNSQPSAMERTHYVASEVIHGISRALEALQNVHCFFVRCVRPNSERLSGKFDSATVLRQLRALSVLETCRAIRDGFVRKLSFEEFTAEFRCLLPDELTRGQPASYVTRDILSAQGVRYHGDFRLGAHSVFMKQALDRQLCQAQAFTRNLAALIVQRNVRKWLAQRHFALCRRAAIVLQAALRGWKCRKQYVERKEQALRMAIQECQKTSSVVENGTGAEFAHNSGIKPQLASSAIAEIFQEFPPSLRDSLSELREGKGHDQFRQLTRYLSPNLGSQTPHIDVQVVSVEEFAERHLKCHILGARREPISTPFLPKETEQEFEQSVELFKLILRYLSAEDSRMSPGQLAILAKYIVQQGIDCPSQRDEIFVQLVNQTYKNRSVECATRAWTLLLAAVNAFPPGILVFPMLYHYFNAQPLPQRSLLLHGLLKVLRLIDSSNRLFAASTLEQAAFSNRQFSILNASFVDDESLVIEADAWTTVEEYIQVALRQRGIGDCSGWGLSVDDGIEVTQIAATQFLFDAVAQTEVPRIRAPDLNPFVFFASSRQGHKSGRNSDLLMERTSTGGALRGDKSERAIYQPRFSSPPAIDATNNIASSYPKFDSLGQKQRQKESQSQIGANGGSSLSQFIVRSNNGINGTNNKSNGTTATASKPTHRTYGSSSFDPTPDNQRRVAPPNLFSPRRTNPNCMSRITEEDCQSIASTLPRPAQSKGFTTMFNNLKASEDQYRYFDEGGITFGDEETYPPADYEVLEPTTEHSQMIRKIAASIKGGYGLNNGTNGHHDQRQQQYFNDYFTGQRPNQFDSFGNGRSQEFGNGNGNSAFVPFSREKPQQRFAYQQQQGNFARDGPPQAINNGQRQQQANEWYSPPAIAPSPENFDHRLFMRSAASSTLSPPPPPDSPRPLSKHSHANNRQNPSWAQFLASTPENDTLNGNVYQPNGELYAPGPRRPFAAASGPLSTSSPMVQKRDIPQGNGSAAIYGNAPGGGLRRLPPAAIISESQPMTSNTKYYPVEYHRHPEAAENSFAVDSSFQDSSFFREEDLNFQNEWVPESEASLFDGGFAQQNASQNNGIYRPSAIRSKMNNGAGSGGSCSTEKNTVVDVDGKQKSSAAVQKRPPAIAYAKQPFELEIRKEIFAQNEVIDDRVEIDLIFAQIIRDCRRNLPHRIRKYERDAVNQLLRSYNIPPSALSNPAEIAMNVKLELIGIVRKWPLYFCRLFSVVEERPGPDRVPLLLGVAETGLRLISRQCGAGDQASTTTIAIQDHFEYGDIAELVLENEGQTMRVITRQNISILLTSVQMPMIKRCIESYLIGVHKRKHFVVATADYVTREPNLLSFECGDYIQLVDRPETEKAPASGVWLYGKLENNFGWIPADYVAEADQDLDQYSTSRAPYSDYGGIGNGHMSMSAASPMPRHFFAGGQMLPSALEPLYSNNDPTLYGGGGMDGEGERFTMAEFAMRFFRRPKQHHSSAASGRSDWTWREVTDKVKFSDRPITHSLLRLESNEADKLAQNASLCAMRFMGDEALKRNQSLTDCVYELLSICHAYVPMRDEVYCQLVKQITGNRSERCSESAIKGWRLLSIACAYFACSDTLKPYLVKYLSDTAFDQRRAFHAIAKQCLHNLAQTFRYGGRRLILSAAEVEAITSGKSVRRQVYNLPGGHRKIISTRPVTVAEEIVQALCLEMNVRSVAEQQEFSLCYILEKDNSVSPLSNDEYVLDVCTDLEAKNEEFLLALTRTVWLHPLRRDCDLYTDALFFQLVPNYISGLFTSLRSGGTATAATLSEVATLGALLVLSDPSFQEQDSGTDVSISNIPSLVPKTILQFAGVSIEQWVDRIGARVQELIPRHFSPIRARQEFIELLEKWPLFGAAFFFVLRVVSGGGAKTANGGNDLFNCVLAINKFGIRALTDGTHEVLMEYALDEIQSMAKYAVSECNFLELRLTEAAAQKRSFNVITIQTDLGSEISRLIGQYIYLNKGNEKEPIYVGNEPS